LDLLFYNSLNCYFSLINSIFYYGFESEQQRYIYLDQLLGLVKSFVSEVIDFICSGSKVCDAKSFF
jgi:hypothetical protein